MYDRRGGGVGVSFQDHWIGTVQNAFRNTFWGVAFGTRAERRNSPVLLTIMYYTYYLYYVLCTVVCIRYCRYEGQLCTGAHT